MVIPLYPIDFNSYSCRILTRGSSVLEQLDNPVNPANFSILVAKLSDVLVKALDVILGYVMNWCLV